MAVKKIKDKYFRKQVNFFLLLQKIKLWPSRSGILHGIQSIKINRETAEVLTHCEKEFTIRYSKRSRAARWLRNKWHFDKCKECHIPDWKIEKYSKTHFSQHRGTLLRNEDSWKSSNK